MKIDSLKEADYKFSFWGMRPNAYKKGANLLFFLAIYNIGSFLFLHDSSIVIVGILFGILGGMVYKNLNFGLSIGAFLWMLGIILFLIDIATGSVDGLSANSSIKSGRLFLQVAIFWALVKSMPLYHYFYANFNKLKNV